MHATVKCERFFTLVYFSNETVSWITVSTGPVKMFRLERETMNVCQRNVVHFVHVECRFDKINDIFQGFGSFVSLQLQKDGCAKSKQIWTNLLHWNTGGYRCEELLFFNLHPNVQFVRRDIVTTVIYYYITTKFHYASFVTLAFQHGSVGIEVSYFCYKNIKISAKMSIKVFPHTNL